MMRTDELPAETLDKGWNRLVAVFGEPNSGTKDGWTWTMRAATRGWSEMEFHVAVKDAATNCRYFPKPAEVLTRRPGKQVEVVTDHTGENDICRACGQRYRYAGYQQGVLRGRLGNVIARFRCDCPKSDPGWHTEAAASWSPLAHDAWMIDQGLVWAAAVTR